MDQLLETVAIEPMNLVSGPPTEILGQLNAVEERYAPEQLFCAGDLGLLRRLPLVSVVGSRRPTAEGQRAARDVAHAVVTHGGVVVSGLARGVDTIAHRSAMECGGRTVAVLGTSLHEVYPRENESLQKDLMEKHLVLSQFPSGHPSQRGNFVRRNRTMALVTQGTVVVEAGEKSGTQHQGWEAIRLGRILFLPETLLSASFDWPRKMYEYGAIQYRDAHELVELLDEYLPCAGGVGDGNAILR